MGRCQAYWERCVTASWYTFKYDLIYLVKLRKRKLPICLIVSTPTYLPTARTTPLIAGLIKYLSTFKMPNEVRRTKRRKKEATNTLLLDVLTGVLAAPQSSENEPQKSTVNIDPLATPV